LLTSLVKIKELNKSITCVPLRSLFIMSPLA
jgi:hypothetical protein